MSYINLDIRNLMDRVVKIKVKTSDTIGKGKEIYIREGRLNNTSVKDIQWKFDGRVLNDEKTFDFYSFEDDDAIISNDRVIGGKKENQNIKFI